MSILDQTRRLLMDQAVDDARPAKVEVTLNEGGVFLLLIASASDMARDGCDAPDCEACNDLKRAWWDLCNALTCQLRRQLQAALRDADIDLPGAPWE